MLYRVGALLSRGGGAEGEQPWHPSLPDWSEPLVRFGFVAGGEGGVTGLLWGAAGDKGELRPPPPDGVDGITVTVDTGTISIELAGDGVSGMEQYGGGSARILDGAGTPVYTFPGTITADATTLVISDDADGFAFVEGERYYVEFVAPPPPEPPGALLLEDGESYLLLEDDGKILLG